MEAPRTAELAALRAFAERRYKGLPKGFGEGWMTKSAQSMVRVAALAGFDAKDLLTRLAKLPRRGERTLNAGTVERIMGQMADEINA
jgi:hypothetical protein